MLIGRKSAGAEGFVTLDTGETKAFVHSGGKIELLMERMTMSRRGGMTASPVILNVFASMPSTPCALVVIEERIPDISEGSNGRR